MKAILWIATFLFAGTYVCGPLVDPDLGWHITVGRWILANWSVPTVDHWNLFAFGTPWRAYSWSNEVLFALADSLGGSQGLLALKVAFGILLSGSLFYCLSKISGDWFFGALLGVFATCACYNHFTLRPQTLTWIFFVWLIWVTEKVSREGLTLTRALCFVLLMALWANTHITTAVGLATVFFWLIRPDKASLVLAFQVVGICFIGTLFTPYMGGEWLTFLSKTGHPFAHRSIAEFQSATIMQFSTGFVVLVLVLLLAFLHFKPKAIELPKLAFSGILLLGGLAVVKFLPLSVIVLCALVALLWSRVVDPEKELGNLADGFKRLKNQILRIPAEGLSFVILCLAFLNIAALWDEPVAKEVVPEDAMTFVLDQNLPHPLLNDFGHGGYVMYRTSDKSGVLSHRVPIDGRTNVVPPDVWEKFQAAYHGTIRWREYLELVKPETILWRIESPLIPILFAEGRWCMIYGDPSQETGFSVLVKREFYDSQRSRFSSANCNGTVELGKENLL